MGRCEMCGSGIGRRCNRLAGHPLIDSVPDFGECTGWEWKRYTSSEGGKAGLTVSGLRKLLGLGKVGREGELCMRMRNLKRPMLNASDSRERKQEVRKRGVEG
jgi:hypothetical protein